MVEACNGKKMLAPKKHVSSHSGLDIGDVDLIICYDAPKSPIRLVQRMGRTGRKREGRIVVLVTKGKEEQVGYCIL